MSIYFVQPLEGGPVKIGYARDVAARLRDLQIGSPVRLQVVAEMPGGISEERALHRRFASHRLHGEWFDPNGQITDFIRGLRATSLVTYEVVARPIAHRRMPRGRWLGLCRAIVAVLDESQPQTAREAAERTGLPEDSRGAKLRLSRVSGCLRMLHDRGWVEKEVSLAPPGYRARPHRWRLAPGVADLIR